MTIRSLGWLAILVLAASVVTNAQPVTPVSWRASLSPATLELGGTAAMRVEASIDAGWHVYSATQAGGGPIPTTVKLVENRILTSAGKLRQGAFETKRDPVFDMEVQTFSHQAWLELPVRVDSGVSTGTHEAQVRVRYQACSARVCLPPTERLLTVQFELE